VLKLYLEEAGADVLLTRSTDTLVDKSLQQGRHIKPDLLARCNLANNWSPDFFISIHINSWTKSTANGIETYYNKTSLSSQLSRTAAEFVQHRLVSEFGCRSRGVKTKLYSDAVLQSNDFPAVLTEILFISNPTEELIMAEPDFPQRAAAAVFKGVRDYYASFGGDRR